MWLAGIYPEFFYYHAVLDLVSILVSFLVSIVVSTPVQLINNNFGNYCKTVVTPASVS